MQTFSIMTMLGGLCLFLFGMGLAKEGLQLVAGEKLRTILHSLTDRRIMADSGHQCAVGNSQFYLALATRDNAGLAAAHTHRHCTV